MADEESGSGRRNYTKQVSPGTIGLLSQMTEMARTLSLRLRSILRHGWLIGSAVMTRLRRARMLYFLVAGGLVLAVVLGVADVWLGRVSWPSILVLSLAAMALVAVFREKRTARILPFGNLVQDDAGRLSGISSGFAELLDAEIRRIIRLQAERRSTQPLPPGAVERGETPGRRLQFSTGTHSGFDTAVSSASLSVGPLNLPLGGMAIWLSKVVGRAISGSVVAEGPRVRLNIAWSGRPNRKWIVEGDDESGERSTREMAREAAARIIWDIEGSTKANADWRSFALVIDGLESMERFTETGRLGDLDRAEENLRRAVILSPDYAIAFYNLGLALEARFQYSKDQDDPADAVEHIRSIEYTWEQALQRNPDLPEAHLELARLYWNVTKEAHEDLSDKALYRCEKALGLAQRKGRLMYPYHHLLGAILGTLAAYRLDVDGMSRATWHFRSAERDARNQRWILRIRGATAAQVEQNAQDLALVAVDEGLAWKFLAEQLHENGSNEEQSGLTAARRSAARALTRALRYRSNDSAVLTDLGVVLESLGSADSADRLIAALESDRTNLTALFELAAIFAARGMFEVAAETLRLVLASNPRHKNALLALAEYASTTTQEVKGALGLAGLAMAVEPTDVDAYRMMGDLWGLRDPTHPRAAAYALIVDLFVESETTTELEQRLVGAGQDAEVEAAMVPVLERSLAWLRAQTNGDVQGLIGFYASTDYVDSEEDALVHHEIARRTLDVDSTPSEADLLVAIRHFEAGVGATIPLDIQTPILWTLDLADAYAQVGKNSQAHKLYTTVVDHASSSLFVSSGDLAADVRGEGLGVDALSLGPQARALAARASVSYALGRDADAIDDCMRALRSEPFYAYPYLILADVHRRRDDFSKSLAALDRALELFPAIGHTVHTSAGETLVAAAEFESRPEIREAHLRQAEQRLKSARSLSRTPDEYIGTQQLLIDCLVMLDEKEQAIAEWKVLVSQVTDQTAASAAHLGLARAYDKAGRYSEAGAEYSAARDKAIEAYDAATEADRVERAVDLADVLNDQAWFLVEQLTNLEVASETANEAVTLARMKNDPDFIAACLDTKGWILYRRSLLEEAVAVTREAVNLAVPNSERRAHLALALEARAHELDNEVERHVDLAEARSQWELIVRLDPHGEWSDDARRRLTTASKAE